ncbi:MAG: hypothetical protein V2J42_14790 [Wenzhouxiangella sp.]|nr:hypothetical protein [Wenzhouxiangella sp.]
MNNKKLLPCLIEPELCQALHDSPAVLVHGPASAHSADIWFHHFRDKDGHEVDLVLERSMRRLAR